MRSGCLTATPDIGLFPKSTGAMLVAHGAGSDFALLRLGSVPGPRTALGWTTAPPIAGETLYRVHHPSGDVRHIAVSVACAGCEACASPAAGFLYSDPTFGTTVGGSSGSAAFVDRGSGPQVVGQLKGVCGPDVNNPCLTANRRVDGRFSATFPAIQGWLSSVTTTTLPATIPFSECKPVCRFACQVEACLGLRGPRKQRCVKRCSKNAIRRCRREGRCF